MAWYWIVLIIIGYIPIGILTAYIYSLYGEGDDEMLVLFAIFWPVFLPIAIICAPFMILGWIFDWIFCNIF